jgi:HSP20 family molecular chaperone IbpA
LLNVPGCQRDDVSVEIDEQNGCNTLYITAKKVL